MNPESGVKTDLENAYYYFDKSAKQGFLPAYRQAAGMAAQGIGTQKNMAEAKRLMKFAADEGVNRTAEEYAVLVFSDNESTNEEKATAVEFLEAEVEEGMSYLANYVLAVLYINGEFVEKDMVKAKSLLAFPASGKYANSVELLQQLSGEKVIAQDNENPKSTAGLDSSIETITVTGISINMGDVHGLMLSELRKHHGQTGSRIKGNGCKRGDPQCVILDSGSIRTPTFWQVGTTR
ncbi:sel1 repeat family protein [Alteromonas macleodii]|uniref:Sel1 repeat family protein n=2 Tax=Alteromonas macleodii TaxID=28108 RepID=A0AB36G0W5_ALTMA|nr:sel1 repeat family protein [Alteromonas macleodii]OES35616.1 sel1 repeat family protein [Alteromonas macleodii]OES42408.1 sel1 repeat family protein [Alteromonas macleodii]